MSRKAVYYSFNGESLTIKEISEKYKVHPSLVYKSFTDKASQSILDSQYSVLWWLVTLLQHYKQSNHQTKICASSNNKYAKFDRTSATTPMLFLVSNNVLYRILSVSKKDSNDMSFYF